jgi:UDP-N-acetylglucosamine/UDP-N-acetylgalactosamine diphosphorylase
MNSSSKVDQLIAKGVRIPSPHSIEIGHDVDVDRISGQGVTLHAGCKLMGPQTFIAPGAQIGYEGPVTIEDCYIGPEVVLKGGFFQQATFLHQASCGLGSHVRQGTILEEHAGIAHTVGLKQTILFPFVTLGSLINFCDCLMAGGTGPKNHSEVGSSYIHFNFTPNQDKATPSLIGEVTQGVMLNQSPIFLGGQGGIVGPIQIAYGTVIAAGSICRKDQLKPGNLVIEGGMPTARMPFNPGQYQNMKRLLKKNFHYIAQLTALRQWYLQVRSCFIGNRFPKTLHDGLVSTLAKGITERVRQLEKLKDKIQAQEKSRQNDLYKKFYKNWSQIETKITALQDYAGVPEKMDRFSGFVHRAIQDVDRDYVAVIQSLSQEQVMVGTRWLKSIVDHAMDELSNTIL